MLNKEQSVGTTAEKSTNGETQVTSSHNNGNTPVGCSLSDVSYMNDLKKILNKYEIKYRSEGELKNEIVTIELDGFETVYAEASEELKDWERQALSELEWHGSLSSDGNGGTKKEIWAIYKTHKPVEQH